MPGPPRSLVVSSAPSSAVFLPLVNEVPPATYLTQCKHTPPFVPLSCPGGLTPFICEVNAHLRAAKHEECTIHTHTFSFQSRCVTQLSNVLPGVEVDLTPFQVPRWPPTSLWKYWHSAYAYTGSSVEVQAHAHLLQTLHICLQKAFAFKHHEHLLSRTEK